MSDIPAWVINVVSLSIGLLGLGFAAYTYIKRTSGLALAIYSESASNGKLTIRACLFFFGSKSIRRENLDAGLKVTIDNATIESCDTIQQTGIELQSFSEDEVTFGITKPFLVYGDNSTCKFTVKSQQRRPRFRLEARIADSPKIKIFRTFPEANTLRRSIPQRFAAGSLSMLGVFLLSGLFASLGLSKRSAEVLKELGEGPPYFICLAVIALGALTLFWPVCKPVGPLPDKSENYESADSNSNG